ncbi:hypothetical protein [Stenotrophomonas phage CM2]
MDSIGSEPARVPARSIVDQDLLRLRRIWTSFSRTGLRRHRLVGRIVVADVLVLVGQIAPAGFVEGQAAAGQVRGQSGVNLDCRTLDEIGLLFRVVLDIRGENFRHDHIGNACHCHGDFSIGIGSLYRTTT